MAFESITGSAVATGFLNNYGKYTGSDGIIAKYITNAGIPLTPVILVLIIGCIFLVILNIS